MNLSNFTMEAMAESLAPHLERRDIIGYAAARNTRILRDELVEYVRFRDALIRELGEERGDGSFAISPESERFAEFGERLTAFALLEHEPKLFKLKYSDAIGALSGSELLELDWMFEE